MHTSFGSCPIHWSPKCVRRFYVLNDIAKLLSTCSYLQPQRTKNGNVFDRKHYFAAATINIPDVKWWTGLSHLHRNIWTANIPIHPNGPVSQGIFYRTGGWWWRWRTLFEYLNRDHIWHRRWMGIKQKPLLKSGFTFSTQFLELGSVTSCLKLV